MNLRRDAEDGPLLADLRFFQIFLPRELELVQHHNTERHIGGAWSLRERFLSFYLLRLETGSGTLAELEGVDRAELTSQMHQVMVASTCPSDVPGQLSALEYLVVCRQIEPGQSHSVAQQMVDLSCRAGLIGSDLFRVYIGYVVYPLSVHPDLAVADWPALVELARKLSVETGSGDNHGGYGVVRGSPQDSPTIPEIDMISLAMTDLGALGRADLLQVRQVQIVPET
jgi:hypothetical protein